MVDSRADEQEMGLVGGDAQTRREGERVRKFNAATSMIKKQATFSSTNNKQTVNDRETMIYQNPYGLPNVSEELKKLVRCIEAEARDFVFGWCW